MTANFYPRPPRGGRPGQRHCADHLQNFYPRPPRGGRPATALHRGKAAVFLSTPSARRATFWRFRNGLCDEISIHALREEGDAVGKDLYLCAFKFLSTPSARRATCPYKHPGSVCAISIHALREEGDRLSCPCAFAAHISIHALREEGDTAHTIFGDVQADFYPRPPRGGRHAHIYGVEVDFKFLSTPSARRATVEADLLTAVRAISIHALREEGDLTYPPLVSNEKYFYPRPPRGGRRICVRTQSDANLISIHALREEGDFLREPQTTNECRFLSTPSARRAT